MFRGGDYIDNPRFYEGNNQPKNSLDIKVTKLMFMIIIFIGYTRNIAKI